MTSSTNVDGGQAGAQDDDHPVLVDAEVRRIYGLLSRIAGAELPVLVLGETGSGKEGAAEWIHRCSPRAHGSYVRVNCASLSESMLEAELFGHERGAFTGAVGERDGWFAAAHGGTLLLDEVAELSLRSQAKLLRVLETGEVTRLGSTRPRRVDVRVVAATHRDLATQVARGEFRQDLYFRLDGLTVEIPPLRRRPDDVLPLAQLFLRRFASRASRSVPALSAAATALLVAHDWPGNVRELRNAMARAAALCAGDTILPEHVALSTASAPRASAPPTPSVTLAPVAPQASAPAVEVGDMREQMRAFERARILAALGSARGNQTRAAQLLGVSRRTLTNKLNAHGIARPFKRVEVAVANDALPATLPLASVG
jgi:DNA-binding NtrC family response regulator